MTNDALKPCPFCGGTVHVVKAHCPDMSDWIKHDTRPVPCGLEGFGNFAEDVDVVTLWNTRAQPSGDAVEYTTIDKLIDTHLGKEDVFELDRGNLQYLAHKVLLEFTEITQPSGDAVKALDCLKPLLCYTIDAFHECPQVQLEASMYLAEHLETIQAALIQAKLPFVIDDNGNVTQVTQPKVDVVSERKPKMTNDAPWETFCDESYYDMWAVRPKGDSSFISQKLFHVQTKEEADALCEELNTRAALEDYQNVCKDLERACALNDELLAERNNLLTQSRVDEYHLSDKEQAVFGKALCASVKVVETPKVDVDGLKDIVMNSDLKKTILSWAFEMCQPKNGDVFCWIDENIDSLIKHLAAQGLLSLTQWQSIETAPRDDTDVLVFLPRSNQHKIMTARYRPLRYYPSHGYIPKKWVSTTGAEIGTPTHWMPLPAAPKKEG